MIRRLPMLLAAAALVLMLAACGLFSHTAPAGQPPLADVDARTIDALKTEFNQAQDGYRVIALLSPT